MKLAGFSIVVSSGAAFRGSEILPIVRMVIELEGQEPLKLAMAPDRARRIALDLLSSTSMSWADAGIRSMAREHGLDGDTMVGEVLTFVKESLDKEGE